MRVVYCGASASMVVLERLAHLDPAMLPADLVLSRLRGELSVVYLEAGVDVHDQRQTQARGAQFLSAKSACVLRVPSVLVPEEGNLVVNPAHPAAAMIQLIDSRDFQFDRRLLKHG
jgi:RES domain-containing protein